MPKRFYGSLARSGKVKNQTPLQPKETNHKYRHKYGAGKHKFSTATTATTMDHCEEEEGHVITFHNYNTLKGLLKLEIIEDRKEERISREKESSRWNRCSTDTNHKKWYRNHPKQGFYQSRQQIDNELI